MLGNKKRKKHIQSFSNVNLVPLLDFIVAVIPVLLLSVSFIEYVALDASLPAFVNPEESSDTVTNEEKLGLTVAITEQGFVVGGQGGLLSIDGGEKIIKREANGSYNYVSLSKKMMEIKKKFSKEWTVIIVPESDTRFEVLVATMDATREYNVVDASGNIQKTILFPNVVLGGGIL